MTIAQFSMNPAEKRASYGLAGIYGLRMLGLFIILPVFALYASHLPGGENHTLMGLALGAYGLTQAILQIPAGWLSDRYGRKPVIYAGLVVFAIGSLIAASADSIYGVILGRTIQGAGAINAAVMALTADLTREEVRTKAMAMIGMTIGLTFSFSLILSPVLNQWMGVPGLFALTGILSVVAILLVRFIIPNPKLTHFHSDTEASGKKFREVLRNPDLLRLDFGIFSLHAILMSVFMQVPFILESNGLPVTGHWKIYLPVMLIAFILMVPPIIIAEKKAKMKPIFLLAIALALGAQGLLLAGQHSLWLVAFALLVFFTAFNILEATLPSLISKIAPLAAKGTAMGVYSSVQFFGAFFGASMGGVLMQFVGHDSVLLFSMLLLATWLLVASGMRPPKAVTTKLYHLAPLSDTAGQQLQQQLAAIQGVHEVVVIASEEIACLKVEMSGFDEEKVQQLVLKGTQYVG